MYFYVKILIVYNIFVKNMVYMRDENPNSIEKYNGNNITVSEKCRSLSFCSGKTKIIVDVY